MAAPAMPEDDPHVNEERVLQQQEQEEPDRVAAEPLDVPELAGGGQDEGDEEPADKPKGHPAGGLPVEALLQGDEQEQAEENALEDVFGLGPAHGGIRCG